MQAQNGSIRLLARPRAMPPPARPPLFRARQLGLWLLSALGTALLLAVPTGSAATAKVILAESFTATW